MSTQLNLKYSITFNASTKVIDPPNEMSSEDSVQQQVMFNTNSLINSEVHRTELALLPTPYQTPNAARVYDINLESIHSGYLRVLYIKSEAQFLYSTSDTSTNLAAAPRSLVRLIALDRGCMISPNAFTPDIPYPKFIRLMNPLEVNGGGDGNNGSDTPLIVSVFAIITPATV